MDKYYIVENEDFLKIVNKYKKDSKERDDFFKNFCERNGIDGNEYYFGGLGSLNTPFKESQKRTIYLHISETENNLKKFETEFKKAKIFDNLLDFKKSSKLLKQFQDECIDKQVVINLYSIRIGDYFKELTCGGYWARRFEMNGKYYLKVRTTSYDTITPLNDGFIEINGSEFHTKLEELKAIDTAF